ncbi:Phage major capsid protein [Deinococcus marmoris]|uniref:Phage major capsid protein n=2 Tax=Deinococcus marmoris TaxID=249408 RepID=A0A1U7P303_9DEIO|nr:Phage major capsid protein [Deinococcus marmoris]
MSYETKNEGTNSKPDSTTEVIKTELARIGTEMKGAMDAQSIELKKFGQTTQETGTQISALGEKYTTLEAEMKARIDGIEAKAGRLPAGGEREEYKSLGRQFVGSEAFKNAQAGLKAGHVDVMFEAKAVPMTSGTNAPGVVQAQVLGYRESREALAIRPLFAQGQTESDSIKLPQVQSWTNAAAQVKPGNKKPESTGNFKVVTFPVVDIATFVRVHRNMINDAAFVQSVIDERLQRGLRSAENAAFIKGDGADDTIKGVLAQSATFARHAVGDTKLDVLRRAATDLRMNEHVPDALVVHPYDLEDIELLKGNDDHYIYGVTMGPDGRPRVWRMPVVDTPHVDEGQFIAGDFAGSGQVFQREEINIRTFEQDADNVTYNLMTIRAEERLGLVIFDITAFVKGTYTV